MNWAGTLFNDLLAQVDDIDGDEKGRPLPAATSRDPNRRLSADRHRGRAAARKSGAQPVRPSEVAERARSTASASTASCTVAPQAEPYTLALTAGTLPHDAFVLSLGEPTPAARPGGDQYWLSVRPSSRAC